MNNFAQACKECYEDWDASLPDVDSLPDPQYSKKHIKRMKKLFDQMRGNKYHHLTRRAVKVMVAAAVIFALMLCAFAIPSSRNYIIERFDGFGVFTITENNDNAVNGIEVGYIPEGFELTEKYTSPKTVKFIYKSSNGKAFTINKNASDSNVLFNTEDGKEETIVKGNTIYSFITNNSDSDCIIWQENDYIYCIRGVLAKEEFLKIAEKLK